MNSHQIRFLDAATNAGQALPTEYDAALVLLSYLTIVIASSAALLIAWRVRDEPAGPGRVLWLALGALTLGLGVWAMHFVAMLAMSLQSPITYDVPITVISVLPAIAAGAVCLTGAIRGTTGWLVGSGLAMGLGIGAMHYIGMAAMRVSADMLYNPWLFVLSLVVAPSLAIASLYTVRWAIRQTVTRPGKALLLSGAIMGLAVAAMHYTGMWAASYFPLARDVAGMQASGMDSTHLAMAVAGAIFTIVALAVAAVVTDYRLKQLKAAADSEAEKFGLLLEAVPDGIIGVNAKGEIRLLNSRVEDLFQYRKELLLGRPFDMLMPGRFGDTSEYAGAVFFSDSSESATVSSLKLRGRRADQSEFPAEISLNRITTAEGPLTICAIRDVTEQEEAREALREANVQLTAGMTSLESQSKELQFLTDMGELLHGCEEEQEAYEIVSNLGVQLLPGTLGAVYMLSRSRNVLQSTATWGDSVDAVAPVFEPQDCWALRRGRMYAATGRQPAIQCRHVNDEHDGYMCLPMLAHGEVLGVLHVVAPANGTNPANGATSPLERKRIVIIAMAEMISTAVANL
ncbi:MAG TPA: MHYT domain-containing protein, partial [Woeseiaceae bacterium]